MDNGDMSQKLKMTLKRTALGVLGALVLLFIIGILAQPAARRDEERRTAEAVAHIQAQRITLADVDGLNLPPVPDPTLVDATVEGIDANNNLIRDDVEIAIFERYPNDPVIRSAMLQYAMGLQLKQTQVFNSDTWVAAVQQSGRGSGCVSETRALLAPTDPRNMSEEEFTTYFQEELALKDEFQGLIYNTQTRQDKKAKIYQEYATSYGSVDGAECDIDPTTFLLNEPNE